MFRARCALRIRSLRSSLRTHRECVQDLLLPIVAADMLQQLILLPAPPAGTVRLYLSAAASYVTLFGLHCAAWYARHRRAQRAPCAHRRTW